jgi:hypothetical protein
MKELSYRQLSFVLAGLRALQEELTEVEPHATGRYRDQLVDLDGGRLEMAEEIDALCEELNGGDPNGQNSSPE